VCCHVDEITVDKTGKNILLFVRKGKGDQHKTATDKPLLQIQILAVHLLADVRLADLMEVLSA
jgi:hypothetical protein